VIAAIAKSSRNSVKNCFSAHARSASNSSI